MKVKDLLELIDDECAIILYTHSDIIAEGYKSTLNLSTDILDKTVLKITADFTDIVIEI